MRLPRLPTVHVLRSPISRFPVSILNANLNCFQTSLYQSRCSFTYVVFTGEIHVEQRPVGRGWSVLYTLEIFRPESPSAGGDDL
jgi:hypothetical protein